MYVCDATTYASNIDRREYFQLTMTLDPIVY